MSAGLPGLGLGGLFFIISALIAPFTELVRTLRGGSSVGRWIAVGRQFALALTMIAAVDLALRAAYAAISLLGLGDPPGYESLTVLPLVPIAITAGLLASVLAVAKSLELGARLRAGALPPVPVPLALPSGPRLLGAGAALVAAWFALLFVGASQLSPLSDGGGAEARPPELAERPVAEGRPEASAGESGATQLSARSATGRSAQSSGGEGAPDGTRGSSTEVGREASGRSHPAGAGTGSQASGPGGGGSAPAAPESPPAAPPADTTPPASAGPPADVGPPGDAGPPADAGSPTGGGPPADAGPSPSAGPPADAGPESTGVPIHAGAGSPGTPPHAEALGRTG